MTFDEWNTIYITAPKDSELEKFSIVQMRETVETPDDIWLYQHYSNSWLFRSLNLKPRPKPGFFI